MYRSSVSDIGAFIQHKSCQRRFRLNFDGGRLFRELDFDTSSFFDVDPVLQQAGKAREDQWEASLAHAGLIHLAEPYPGDHHVEWFDFMQAMELLDFPDAGFAREVAVDGKIGAFELRGRMDFVVLEWHDGTPHLRLVECKASRRDKTYHRVQAVIYRELVRDLVRHYRPTAAGVPIDPEHVDAVIVRIDESTGALQSILDVEPPSLSDALAHDVRRLLADGGILASLVEADVEAIPYRLEAKCDACHYAPHCFTNAAKGRRLELLGITPGTVRSLHKAGVPDIDALADLDVDGAEGDAVRAHPEFAGDLGALNKRAQARRATLDATNEAFEAVQWLPGSGYGQLPEHEVKSGPNVHDRLIRVFMNVTYDYAESRIAGLAAHITDSTSKLAVQDGEVIEIDDEGDAHEPTFYEVVRFKRAPWTGHYELDNGGELELVQSFFREVVDAIQLIAQPAKKASVHFYVWSRYEMRQLLEACSRVGSGALANLRELLGCREKLEQLIYSCVQQDIVGRYAIGWTGSGLVVASSVPWFGEAFDWRRKIGSEVVDLCEVFERDVFDFKRPLYEGDTREWEVRARFADNLVAPYWNAYWGTLEAPEDRRDGHVEDYLGSARPGALEHYLRGRAQATRWLEERIKFRNKSIEKAPVVLADLPRFRLETEDAVSAAIDFLRFDQHVKFTDWVRDELVPPFVRVSTGMSLPVRDLKIADERGYRLRGKIDPETYQTTLEALRARCPLEEGSFIRMVEVRDPHGSPTFLSLAKFGRTCLIKALDWRTGDITLQIIGTRRGDGDDAYLLPSFGFSDRYPPYAKATLDASISDYVSRRVEGRLLTGPGKPVNPEGAHVKEWFNPQRPSIRGKRKPAREAMEQVASSLKTLGFSDRRVEIVQRGLSTRVQLVQGPPGTGKTTLTSAAILARILAQVPRGVVLVAANTHIAVDTFLERIRDTIPRYAATLLPEDRARLENLRLFKADGREAMRGVEGIVLRQKQLAQHRDRFNELTRDGVALVGGPTGALIKFGEGVGRYLDDSRGTGFLAPLMIVDEASMMVFAHFLALASHVHPDGSIMLAGDHRQLSPIVAHDWANEDRPPAVLYQPHVSAFEGIRSLIDRWVDGGHDARLSLDGLEVTYRLPRDIRELINPVYAQDGLTLRAPEEEPGYGVGIDGEDGIGAVWEPNTSLVLVLHDEETSQQSNAFEVGLIRDILGKGASRLGQDSVAVITPHRAQRALLKEKLEDYQDLVAMIDTVERMQGGECNTIVYSATVSDPVAVAANEEFILDLNRSNVAFSRTKKRLIVVCSRVLLDHIPDGVDAYEAAILWKLLRQTCTRELATFERDGTRVRVLATGPQVSR